MQATAVQSCDIPFTGSKRWIVRILPSLTDLVFLLPILILFALLPGARQLLQDAGTGWHIRVGEWILKNGRVPTEDLFSFTKAHQAWFAWEWAWDVLAAWIHHAGGLAGVVLANVLILSVVAVLEFRLIRRFCENDIVSLFLTAIAVAGSTIHWLARPHLLSWVFFLAFAHAIFSAEEGKRKPLYWVPLLMVLWTNLHGSFIFGLVMLAISAFAPWLDVALANADVAEAWTKSRPYFACTLTCFAVTFINPYGWRLHQHVLSYLSDGKQIDAIQEFQSISFHHGPAILFEAILILGCAAMFWCVQHRRWTGLLSLLLWTHMALFAVRNVPLFLFLATPWIGCMAAGAIGCLKRLPWLASVTTSARNVAAEFRPIERMERLYAVSALGLIWVALNLASSRIEFDPKEFPAGSVPMIEHLGAKRILTTDQWGSYLIYQLYPKTRVFIDDRSDFYGLDLMNRTARVLNGRWDWETDLKRFSVDMVIVKPEMPVATLLKGSRQWRPVFDDGSVTVFAATSASAQQEIAEAKRNSAVANNGRNELGVREGLQAGQ